MKIRGNFCLKLELSTPFGGTTEVGLKPFEKIDLFYAGRVRDRAPTRTLWLF